MTGRDAETMEQLNRPDEDQVFVTGRCVEPQGDTHVADLGARVKSYLNGLDNSDSSGV